MEGLTINLKEFEKLPNKKQMSVLFENTEQLKFMVTQAKELTMNHEKDNIFHRKITYSSIFSLAILFGLGKFVGVL